MSTIIPTVEEAAALLDAAKKAETERAGEAKREAAARAKAEAVLERQTEADVTKFEAHVEEVLAEASKAPTLVHRGVRKMARSYLLGQLNDLPELMGPEHLVVGDDPTAARLLDLARAAGQLADRVLDPAADGFLSYEHPLAVRIEEAENRAYAAFMGRVHVLAGY